MFGSDANWGRVLCAIGYSGADVDVKKVDVSYTHLQMELDGKTVTIGGIAKGSGMIHINMGTMLSFVKIGRAHV